MINTISVWLIGALGFIVAFGLAVMVHELGHFLAAKLFKVPVERFVIGFDKDALPFMPRCIWERKIGETVYGLSLVPLGGYVKMKGTIHPDLEAYLGEDGDGEPAKKDDGEAETHVAEAKITEAPKVADNTLTGQAMQDQAALYKKPLYQKVIIYSGGVLMNLLLAMVVVTIMAVKGTAVDAPLPAVVAWQEPDSWLVAEGINPQDKILAVDGTAISNNEEYEKALEALVRTDEAQNDEDYTFYATVTFERDGKPFAHEFSLPWKEKEKIADLFYGITSRPAYIDYVVPNKPAYKAGLKVGDTILMIGDEPIDDWYEAVYILRGSLNKELTLTVARDDEQLALAMTPTESTRPGEDGVGQIGIWRGNPDKVIDKKDLLTAASQSPIIIWNNTVRYAGHLKLIGKRILHGEVRKVREDLGGPAAIAQMAGIHANLGLDRFLEFMIMLNIALAVMNILPLPILDGGHIVMATYEAIFGKPIPPKILVPVLNGAMIVLLAFFVLITFSDIFKIFAK